MNNSSHLSNINSTFIDGLKKDQESEGKFKDVFYSIYDATIPYIPFRHIVALEKSILKTTLKILEHFNLSSEVNPLWGIEGIRAMFLKGANPATAEYISVTVNVLEDEIKKTQGLDTLSVIEFGTGAGWATLILWNMLQDKNATLYTVDNSPYAIASTTLLLDYFSVPYVIVKGKDLKSVSGFKGVVIHFNDFVEAIEFYKDDFLDAAYSNHGTSYLSKEEHKEFIQMLSKKMKTGASFVTDSLNPQMRLSLNKLNIIWRVIKGGNVENPPKEKFASTQKGNIEVITSLYDMPALRFMDLLHYYLFHSFSIFKGYMNTVKESEKTQQELYEKIGTPSAMYYSNDIHTNLQAQDIPEKAKSGLPVFVQTAWLRKE